MMKICMAIMLLAIISAGVSGCSNDKQVEETHTKGWYLQNEIALKEKISECGSNPGELKSTPNCVNAKKALQSKSLGTW